MRGWHGVVRTELSAVTTASAMQEAWGLIKSGRQMPRGFASRFLVSGRERMVIKITEMTSNI